MRLAQWTLAIIGTIAGIVGLYLHSAVSPGSFPTWFFILLIVISMGELIIFRPWKKRKSRR